MAEINLNARLPDPPRSVPLYALRAPRVSERALRALAPQYLPRSLEAGARMRSDEVKLVHSQGAFDLAVYRASGGLRFRNRETWQVDDGRSSAKLRDQDAFQRASDFARRLKLIDADARPLRAARVTVGEADLKTGEARERVIELSVALQRYVADIPVDGPGGLVVVSLDQQGEPTGFERIWREIDGVEDRSAALRRPEAALEEMRAQYRAKQGIIEVEQVRFGYFEGGWRHRQRYLQPAYVVIGYATMGERRRKMAYVASALDRRGLRLTPVLRRKPAQKGRPKG